MLTESHILDPKLTVLLFAVLVHKLGGSVHINQTDIDLVAYNQLLERGNEDGSLDFTFAKKANHD